MKRWGFLIMILSVFSVFLLFLSALHQNPVPVSAMQTDFDDESGGGNSIMMFIPGVWTWMIRRLSGN